MFDIFMTLSLCNKTIRELLYNNTHANHHNPDHHTVGSPLTADGFFCASVTSDQNVIHTCGFR